MLKLSQNQLNVHREGYRNVDKTSMPAITQLKKHVIRVELLLPIIIAFFAPNIALSML